MKVEEQIPKQSVNIIFNNITGITNEDLATVFIINVSAGRNLSDYEKNLQIKSSQNFYMALRYMVQEYLMGGLLQESTVDTWLTGFDADFYNIVSDGDFF